MNSYRCPQCDLINWSTTDCCKRCRLPNPANSYPQQFTPQQPLMQNTAVAAAPHTAVQMQFAEMPAYQTPNYQTPNYQTPPQFQQERAGSYSANNAPHYSGQYQPQNNYAVNSDEVIKAEKNVRNGFIGGIVWASLLAFATIVFMILPSAMKSSLPNDPAQNVALVSKVMVFILGAMTVVIGGLSYGVKRKSMVCAILLAVLSLLGVINSLSEKKTGAILFGFLMFGIFAMAASGINTLKKYDLA
jgi:hypothetical protein